jgi:hypothetical protein
MRRGRPTDAGLRAVLFADILAGCFALYVFGSWPPGLVTAMFVDVPLAVGFVCHRGGRLRPVAPWLTRGSVDRQSPVALPVTVVVSTAALTVWALNSTRNLSEYLSDIREQPVWLVVLGITGFALANAAGRRPFIGGHAHGAHAGLGPRGALVIESVAFGISHYSGYPSGLVGVTMADGAGSADSRPGGGRRGRRALRSDRRPVLSAFAIFRPTPGSPWRCPDLHVQSEPSLPPASDGLSPGGDAR